MNIEYAHNLPKEETYNRIDSFLNKMHEKYSYRLQNVNKEWNKDNSIMNFELKLNDDIEIKGKITLYDKKIHLEGKANYENMGWIKKKAVKAAEWGLEKKIKSGLEILLSENNTHMDIDVEDINNKY